MNSLCRRLRPVHGRGEIGPVRKKLNREPCGKGDSCGNGNPFPSKEICGRIGPLAHQPGEQILLNDHELASICLDLGHNFDIERGLQHRVSKAKPRLRTPGPSKS